ncbi:MAG: hypothetical protein IIC64_08590 [SAR324 cluster bacterium]|nr:hypothetical protein [SAR324 cluster bacterium]
MVVPGSTGGHRHSQQQAGQENQQHEKRFTKTGTTAVVAAVVNEKVMIAAPSARRHSVAVGISIMKYVNICLAVKNHRCGCHVPTILRLMFEIASGYHSDREQGRWVIETRDESRAWIAANIERYENDVLSKRA